MDDVVALIGKPHTFNNSTNRYIRLHYGKYLGLTFRDNCLSDIFVQYCKIVDGKRKGLRFSNGLTGESLMVDYLKAFGSPSRTWQNECGSMFLSYEYGQNVLTFYFESVPWDLRDDEEAQQKAQLYEMWFHSYGFRETCGKAVDAYVDAVADLLGVSKKKIQSMRWANELPDIYANLEKALGKPLTEDERKKVATAFETEQKAIEKAEADDENP